MHSLKVVSMQETDPRCSKHFENVNVNMLASSLLVAT